MRTRRTIGQLDVNITTVKIPISRQCSPPEIVHWDAEQKWQVFKTIKEREPLAIPRPCHSNVRRMQAKCIACTVLEQNQFVPLLHSPTSTITSPADTCGF